jgi:hypothetical protein
MWMGRPVTMSDDAATGAMVAEAQFRVILTVDRCERILIFVATAGQAGHT